MNMENVIGRCWPEWKVVEKLGEGSFGAVYKCCKTEHGVEVYSAVKVITITKQDYDDDSTVVVGRDNSLQQYFKGYVDDCLEEIRIMSEIRGCANIVYIEDFKVLENESGIGWTVLIRMELLDKFSSYMRTHSFTEEEVIRFGIDICNALQNCNAYNIIHRDVKPSNILMTKNGTYKLSDFGIARKLENAKSGMSIKGNHMYSAPEVFMGKQYNENVDVYSLGILLYQLMNNNRIPFLSSDKSEVSHREVQQALEMRRQDATFVAPCNASAAFTKIILTACDFNPETRYASAAELKKALEGLLMSSAEQTAVRSEPQSESLAPPLQVSHTPQSEPPAPPLQTSNKSHTPSISPKLAAAVVAVLAFVIVGGLVAFFMNKGRDDLPAQTDSPAQVQQGNVSVADDTVSLLSQAQQLYLDGEYVRSIELYRQIIKKQGTPAAEVKNALAAVENAYRVFILEEAGYLAANNDKAAALAKIDEALRILPDDTRLLERKKQIEATTEPQSATEAQTTTATTAATEQNATTASTTEKEQDNEVIDAQFNGYMYISAHTPDHNGVYLRDNSSESADELFLLAEGTAVETYDLEKNGYVYCRSNGVFGWLPELYLSHVQRKTFTVEVLDSQTKRPVSGVTVQACLDDANATIDGTGTTDRSGQAEISMQLRYISIVIEHDGYELHTTVFDAANSVKKVITVYLDPVAQADTFTQTYNAALDAYYTFLQNNTEMINAVACADISGDGIPELLLFVLSYVYTYDATQGKVVKLTEAFKGFSPREMRYDASAKCMIQSWEGWEGSGYDAYFFDGTALVKTISISCTNGNDAELSEYTVDGKNVTKEEYEAKVNELWYPTNNVTMTKDAAMQAILKMKR